MATFNHHKRTPDNIHDGRPAHAVKRQRTENAIVGSGRSPHRLEPNDYTVGWVCALPKEMAAAEAMLDVLHESLQGGPGDSNAYTMGSIGMHNIVIACLPSGLYGTNNAATVAANMRRSFPSICVGLMVGIGGGAPGNVDIRLGDVVVSNRVVQYDMGKVVQDGQFQHTGLQYRPPQDITTAVARLRAQHEMGPSRMPQFLSKVLERYPSMTRYAYPGPFQDRLFESSYDHVPVQGYDGCDGCDESKLVQRSERSDTAPLVHYGNIASGNQVMKHGKTRDRLARDLDIICFEMEAAGLMDHFPCLVIRGICDYSDSHKHKQWQEYAAAAAAAYAKELLTVLPGNEASHTPVAVSHSEIEEGQMHDRRNELMNSLKFDQIDSRHSSIKAAHAKTCQWLLKHPDYVLWLDPTKYTEHHGFLWINGKPGAGKSTLIKFAYTRAMRSAADDAATIGFFFNARGDRLERTTVGMLRSLILQLLKRLPNLQEVLDDFGAIPHDKANNPVCDVEALQTLFSKAVERLGQRRLTCFIDALDECDEEQVRDMVTYFEDLGQNAAERGIKLYICFSSRHYPYIDIWNGRKLILEDQTGHEEDLKSYVHSRLRAGTGKVIEEVKAQILEKAAGIFMWVILVVDILNREFQRGRIFAVKKRLRETPDKLSELFKDILTRDNQNMNDLMLCIQWILFARRPLRCEQFYYAMVSGLDTDPENLAPWDPEYIPVSSMQQYVLSCSKGLAEITKSKHKTVQFIHESVRDFLIKDNGIRELWPELEDDFASLSHDQLKRCCHTYIKTHLLSALSSDTPLPRAFSAEAKVLRSKTSEEYPLLEYATRNLLYHANGAATRLPQAIFLKDFDLKAWIHLDNLFEPFEVRRHTQAASFLYIAAEHNFADLIITSLHGSPRFGIRGERYIYPLYAALANGHRAAVKALLRQDTTLPQENDISLQLPYGKSFTLPKDMTALRWAIEIESTSLFELLLESKEVARSDNPMALSWAAKKGLEDTVKILLAEGVNVNSRDRHGNTPLVTAATSGHAFIVRMLLAVEGIDVNPQGQHGQTPLLAAIEQGHEAIVKMLLAVEGINVNLQGRASLTPLLAASRCGHETIVQMLLAVEDINVNLQGQHGQTPLLAASERGHETIVKMLLATGDVDVNRPDDTSTTPLMWAALRGNEEVVKLLLETRGIDVNYSDPAGWTPLMWAAFHGHDGVLKLLLDTGSIYVDRPDKIGRTPLISAASRGHEGVVKLLLETRDIDFNCPETAGWTPLMWAASRGHEGVVKLLLAVEGIDTHATGIDGETAFACG